MSLIPCPPFLHVCATQTPLKTFHINLWGHPAISPPVGPSGALAEIGKFGLKSARVNLAIGRQRCGCKSRKCQNTLNCCTVIADIVVSPVVLADCLDQETKEDLITLALRNVIGELAVNWVKTVDNEYFGPKVEFEDSEEKKEILPVSISRLEPPMVKQILQPPNINPGPTVKSGFLNSKKFPALYPEGSNEGRPAGDPLGWLPKGLRDRVMVVPAEKPHVQPEAKSSAEPQPQSKNPSFTCSPTSIIARICCEKSEAQNLEISARQIKIGNRFWALPEPVETKGVVAKFKRGTSELIVTCQRKNSDL